MLKDIVAAKALGDYRLHLRFEDGVEGVVDLASHLSLQGVFEPLRDPAYFAQVRVLSASLRSSGPGSEAVTLRHPVMPVADGLSGGIVGFRYEAGSIHVRRTAGCG
jgi:hypothetical protein